MQRLLVYLFAMLSVAPAMAEARGQIERTTAACGRPTAIRTVTHRHFGSMRYLVYPKANIRFLRSGKEPWQFSVGDNAEHGLLDAAELSKVMPCFRNVLTPR